MHVDVGPKNNCLKWLQLSHPVVSTFISFVRKTPWCGCTHSTDTSCLPGMDQGLDTKFCISWTVPATLPTKTSETTQMEGFMWSSYMYTALQMYVIGDVTVVVWHLYLFGYVLVVYVCDKCGKFRRFYRECS